MIFPAAGPPPPSHPPRRRRGPLPGKARAVPVAAGPLPGASFSLPLAAARVIPAVAWQHGAAELRRWLISLAGVEDMAPSSGAASAAAAAWGPRPQSRFGSGGARAWAMAAHEAWCSSGLGGLWAPWRCRRRRFSWRWARAMGNSCVTGSSSSSDHGQSLKSNGARAIDNSCVTGSCLSNQRQSQEYNRSETTIKWRIDGFSSLLDKGEGWTNSSVFDIRGFKWYLRLNPRDRKSGDKSEYVSLKLVMSRHSERPHTVVEATFKFMIYDQSYGKHHEQNQVSHNFQATSRVSGSSCMIPLATLQEQSSRFLVKDSCVFGIQFIKVVVVKSNDVSETLFVQKISNICSDPQVYTWNIDDFFALKNPSTSPEFELCGHKWVITIYPSGYDKNGNHISLYLRMKALDTIHHDSANLAEISVSIKDQETGKHLKSSGRFQFKKSNPSWGWEKFISLEDFKDSSKGYLVKKKCCIEAQVAVIGSSKTE